jgi:excisionase family DNA binding protein
MLSGMVKKTEYAELTPEVLAIAAGVEARTIRRWIAEGKLTAVRAMPRSPLRIPRDVAADLLHRLGR